MALVINTNIASLDAQNNLSKSQSALQTAMARLSSGLRINSAADDPAGMAIASRMTAQINGMDQAVRNANDGISLAQTAGGALSAISDNLQMLRQLSVQAANATNSASDRATINQEATQLVAEINRVATTTQFNGVNLLDGSFNSQAFQVGANAGQTITVSSIASATSASLGVGSGSSYSTSLTKQQVLTGGLTAGGLVLNGYNVGATTSDGVSSKDASASAIAYANAINAVQGNTGVTASVNATTTGAITATAAGAATVGASVNGVLLGNAGAVTLSTDANAAAAEMAAAVNAVSGQTGVTAVASGATYTLNAADGRNIDLAVTTAGDSGLSAATTYGTINLSSSSSSGITVGGTQAANAGLTIGNTAAKATVGAGVSSIDLTTAAGAQAAITTIDAALNQVNSSAGALGAYQNRFTSAVTNLQTTGQNLTAARSRIQDTDFAATTAQMTRGQILQQAGTAILAQANSQPNMVLSLLK